MKHTRKLVAAKKENQNLKSIYGGNFSSGHGANNEYTSKRAVYKKHINQDSSYTNASSGFAGSTSSVHQHQAQVEI